ncbi:MAG: DUF3575 domain-containing protein [Flavobacterium sp.]
MKLFLSNSKNINLAVILFGMNLFSANAQIQSESLNLKNVADNTSRFEMSAFKREILTDTLFKKKSKKESEVNRDFKNSVKLNVSNKLLYDNAYQFAWERILSKSTSLNVFAGYQEFPLITVNLLNTSSDRSAKRYGYSLGAEYRWYLMGENKYNAPRGVYFGAFTSLFDFNTKRNVTFYQNATDSSEKLSLDTDINFVNLGGSIGYQFVVSDRWVFDFVFFGPSMTYYSFKSSFNSDIEGVEDNEYLKQVLDNIKERLPFLKEVSSAEVSKSGLNTFTAAGFRYNISVGYRF